MPGTAFVARSADTVADRLCRSVGNGVASKISEAVWDCLKVRMYFEHRNCLFERGFLRATDFVSAAQRANLW